MQSFIARTKTFLTPTGSTVDLSKFRTEKDASSLFAQTRAEVDGDDCLHDCASCTEQLPRKWSIDEDDKLYGHVNGWQTHLVVATGKRDWVRDVTDEKGSLMEAVGKIGVELKNGKLMLSASDIPSSSDYETPHDDMGSVAKQRGASYANEGRTNCIVLPKWQVVENIGVKDAKWLLEDFIATGSTNSTPLPKNAANELAETKMQQSNEDGGDIVVQKEVEAKEEDVTVEGLRIKDNPTSSETNTEGITPHTSESVPIRTSIPKGITIRALHHRAIILMCSHGTRDWRCGKSAPILRREFERHLRPLGLYRDFNDERPGGVGVYFINHVGGHKYSANVMIYRREGANLGGGSDTSNPGLSEEAVQGIWLARVRPEDCENIVKYTILQGKLVKPQRQLRGGFDRERGVLSW